MCKDSKPLDDSDFIPVTGKTNIVYEDDDSNISIDKRQDASNKNGLLLAILTLVLALLILWVLVVIVRFVRR